MPANGRPPVRQQPGALSKPRPLNQRQAGGRSNRIGQPLSTWKSLRDHTTTTSDLSVQQAVAQQPQRTEAISPQLTKKRDWRAPNQQSRAPERTLSSLTDTIQATAFSVGKWLDNFGNRSHLPATSHRKASSQLDPPDLQVGHCWHLQRPATLPNVLPQPENTASCAVVLLGHIQKQAQARKLPMPCTLLTTNGTSVPGIDWQPQRTEALSPHQVLEGATTLTSQDPRRSPARSVWQHTAPPNDHPGWCLQRAAVTALNSQRVSEPTEEKQEQREHVCWWQHGATSKTTAARHQRVGATLPGNSSETPDAADATWLRQESSSSTGTSLLRRIGIALPGPSEKTGCRTQVK